MGPPNEFQPLIDEIFREKVLRARASKQPGVLSLDGFDLFEAALELTREGIRGEHPHATNAEIEAEVNRRLAIRRRIDEHGIYRSVT
ncbi:hypothetical protein CfE428DRAFT_1522 [Chthoniobacter flavus Ellin428]|uniref:Uncharacterized protein n=1 Tax=Chthoniobacter flavus Ellin428 TaxID=497964 RepID=B4CY81_9BACT|nr:hypothetical protein [Chthoniobacter flavus]EDY21229.1 hypothetical protein CfE428DRAFT_1522 [Chthoniobacter flavus Ellin428]TCO87597.1 hypothetical protein EV701_12199 [Chthoniobacter flavus]